jgi:hypothetical protein
MARCTLQHYGINFVSDLQQVGDFPRVIQFPPPIKLTHDITDILLKVALNTINQPANQPSTFSSIQCLNILLVRQACCQDCLRVGLINSKSRLDFNSHSSTEILILILIVLPKYWLQFSFFVFERGRRYRKPCLRLNDFFIFISQENQDFYKHIYLLHCWHVYKKIYI